MKPGFSLFGVERWELSVRRFPKTFFNAQRPTPMNREQAPNVQRSIQKSR
jgi:hypothetical protein